MNDIVTRLRKTYRFAVELFQCEPQRDSASDLCREAADEIERLQAERDNANRLLLKEQSEAIGRAAERHDATERLQAIVDRLPKTADGVPVFLADVVYLQSGYGPCRVVANSDNDMLVADIAYGVGEKVDNCYSTREAAEKARTA